MRSGGFIKRNVGLQAKRWGVSTKPREPMAKVGKRGKLNACPDDQWRKQVKAASRGLCVCGKPGAHSHHLFTKAAHGELRHVPANGVFLCAYCHQTAHMDMTAFRAWWASESPEFAAIYDPLTDRPLRGEA